MTTQIIANFFPLRLRGENIRLYTHSFLEYGRKQAHLRVCEKIQQTAQPIRALFTFHRNRSLCPLAAC